MLGGGTAFKLRKIANSIYRVSTLIKRASVSFIIVYKCFYPITAQVPKVYLALQSICILTNSYKLLIKGLNIFYSSKEGQLI